jgi:hypothetical protein
MKRKKAIALARSMIQNSKGGNLPIMANHLTYVAPFFYRQPQPGTTEGSAEAVKQ